MPFAMNQWFWRDLAYQDAKSEPSKTMPAQKIGAKQTRNNPAPNGSRGGKRKRQWR